MLNEQLISELPQLLDLRIPYFDPSSEAMIRMQSKFAEEGYEKLGGVQRWATTLPASLELTLTGATLQVLRRQRSRRLCRWTARCPGMLHPCCEHYLLCSFV